MPVLSILCRLNCASHLFESFPVNNRGVQSSSREFISQENTVPVLEHASQELRCRDWLSVWSRRDNFCRVKEGRKEGGIKREVWMDQFFYICNIGKYDCIAVIICSMSLIGINTLFHKYIVCAAWKIHRPASIDCWPIERPSYNFPGVVICLFGSSCSFVIASQQSDNTAYKNGKQQQQVIFYLKSASSCQYKPHMFIDQQTFDGWCS